MGWNFRARVEVLMTIRWMASCFWFSIVGISAGLWGQCAVDHREDKKAGIVLTDMTISGTKAVSATELADMSGALVGACFDADADLGEYLRAQFQDRGYFKAEVKNVGVKATDPLGVPRPVTAEAEVAEGPQYKTGEVTFVKNRVFPAEQLRGEFPLKPGEVFERGKVARGLEAVWRLYGTKGYLDATMIPETRFGSNGIVDLIVTMEEGPQYRLENVEFAGTKEETGRLQVEWKMAPGSVYDSGYVNEFLETNRALLPEGFGKDSVQVAKNCPKALVAVRVVVEEDGTAAGKNVECEKK